CPDTCRMTVTREGWREFDPIANSADLRTIPRRKATGSPGFSRTGSIERACALRSEIGLRPSATDDHRESPEAEEWRSACGATGLSRFAETLTEPLQEGLHGGDAGAIEQLARVVAFVEELLGSVTLVQDVDVVAFGQRDQRPSGGGRSTSTGIGRIGTRQ